MCINFIERFKDQLILVTTSLSVELLVYWFCFKENQGTASSIDYHSPISTNTHITHIQSWLEHSSLVVTSR